MEMPSVVVGNMAGPIIGAWLSSSVRIPHSLHRHRCQPACVSAVLTAWALPTKQRLIDEVDLVFHSAATHCPSSHRPTMTPPLTLLSLSPLPSLSSPNYSYTLSDGEEGGEGGGHVTSLLVASRNLHLRPRLRRRGRADPRRLVSPPRHHPPRPARPLCPILVCSSSHRPRLHVVPVRHPRVGV